MRKAFNVILIVVAVIVGLVIEFFIIIPKDDRDRWWSETKEAFASSGFVDETTSAPETSEETEPETEANTEAPTEDLQDMSDYETKLYVIAQEFIGKNLNNPKSAKFAPIYECAMQRNGSLMAIQGYLYAENGFGATTKNDFLLEINMIDADSFLYDVVYCNVGGQEIGEFVELS